MTPDESSEPPEDRDTNGTGDRVGQLAEVAAALGLALEPFRVDERLQRIVDVARQAFSAGATSVAILDAAQENLTFRAASGEGADALVGKTISIGVGVAGWVISSGQAIAIGEVTNDPRFAKDIAEQTGYIPQTILAAPLETSDGPVGVIEILDRAETSDSEREMLILALLAELTAEIVQAQQAFTDMGRLLLTSLSGNVAEPLATTIRTAGAGAGTAPELVELAALFAQLRSLGPREHRLAIDVVNRVLAYAKASVPR